MSVFSAHKYDLLFACWCNLYITMKGIYVYSPFAKECALLRVVTTQEKQSNGEIIFPDKTNKGNLPRIQEKCSLNQG